MLKYMADEMSTQWPDIWQCEGESDYEFIVAMFALAAAQ